MTPERAEELWALRTPMDHNVPTTQEEDAYVCRVWATMPGSSSWSSAFHLIRNAGRWRIYNTWNGGRGGRVGVFISEGRGDAGHNECFAWIHANTPFSFDEATRNQGYSVEQAEFPPDV